MRPQRPTPSDGTVQVAPSMDHAIKAGNLNRAGSIFNPRLLFMCMLAIVLGAVVSAAARALEALIHFITNVAFFGRWDLEHGSPADNVLGAWVILVPVAGGLLVGLIARFGSSVIRGDGIPEVMQQVLYNESRIPVKMTFLKPISSAIAIGTGGPFGAEGPIIATGGAVGSVVGQLLRTTPDERKVLLASGAAAGVAANFGTPIAAVLLAIELLLFEYRTRSILPVALASVAAAMGRYLETTRPMFELAALPSPAPGAMAVYTVLGAVVGLAATGVVWMLYAVEDAFEHLPLHWMWWPAIGAVLVGVIGYYEPHTFGVGYDNIENILAGKLTGAALGLLVGLKLASWVFALGSGTAGGTLAPLFTIGGGIGAMLGAALASVLPNAGIDVRMAALVSMAALFTAASRALLTSIIFACEATGQTASLGALLGACSAAFLVAHMVQRNSIMTETLARRGRRVPSEYSADFLEHLLVLPSATTTVDTLEASCSVAAARARILSQKTHHHYPVVDEKKLLVGLVSRRQIIDAGAEDVGTLGDLAMQKTATLFGDQSLRDAVTAMAESNAGAMPVVHREAPRQLVGILTSRDIRVAIGYALQAGKQRTRAIKTPGR